MLGRSSRVLTILLSTAIAVTTLDGCTVNVNIVPTESGTEDTKTEDSQTETSDEQITRGMPEEEASTGEEVIEIPEEVIEEMLAVVENEEADGEKKGDPEMNREMEDIETDYTMDDVAGYWIYEDIDDIYLALYDSGQYEIYDKKTDEVTSDGSYEVKDNEILIEEDGKEPQVMQVISMVRLMDDEGDVLVRFNPDGGAIITEDKGSDKADAESRLYGIYPQDDVTYEDAGNGNTRMSSKSRQVSLTYPGKYRTGIIFDDTLYAYDGDVAYVTVRNLTGEFNNWKGSTEDFKRAVGDTFIPKDFTYFYGKRTDVANTKRNFLTYEQNEKCKTVMTSSCNMWNKKYDIQCCQTLMQCTFSDGAQQLVLLSLYYKWDNKKSYNHIANVRAGAVRNR